MAHNTGSRCAIYDKIDGLSDARTVPELAARLQVILNELAYYAVNGEAAVMETHEEWHTEFTDRLYTAAASDHAAKSARAKFQSPEKVAARARNVNSRNLAPLPPPARSRADDLSPALRAIMDGTHASFGETEGYEGYAPPSKTG
jgi:hypothetical protein